MKFTRDVNKMPDEDKIVINHRIRFPEVRITESDDAYNGVHRTADALKMAEEAGLDLVLLNPSTVPPLVKIVDVGKHKYGIAQREKEASKRNREAQVDLKEIFLRPVTDTHDIEIKAKKAKGFLEDGDKVKVAVKFKGREMAHRDIGQKILDAFCVSVGETAYKVDSPIAMNGRQMMMIISPVKK